MVVAGGSLKITQFWVTPMLYVPASLVKDAENTTLSLTAILQVRVKTMSNAACVDHERYRSSITDYMICAAAPGKDSCQVMSYYGLL